MKSSSGYQGMGSRRKCFGFACSACCALVLGAILILVAFLVPPAIVNMINDTLKDAAPIKDLEKFESRIGKSEVKTTRNAETYYVFNVTNARDVQLGLAKPHLETVELKFSISSSTYNVSFNSDNTEVTYTKWSRKQIEPEYEDVYNNGMITIINPQYVLGVYQSAGSEQMMFAGAAHIMMAQVINPVFEQAAVGVFQLSSVPFYLQAATVALTGTLDADKVPLQWGGISQIGNASSVSSMGGAAVAFTGFELNQQTGAAAFLAQLGGRLADAQIAYLWNPTSPFSLVGAGYQGWVPLVQCAGAAGANALSACFGSDIAGASSIATALGGGYPGKVAALAVALWIGQIMSTDPYFAIAKAGLATSCPEIAQAQSWTDVAALQFGSGKVTKDVWGAASLLDMFGGSIPPGITVAPELSALAASMGMNATAGGGLTMEQSKAFLSKFSDSQHSMPFIAAATEYVGQQPAMLASVAAGYADTGLFFDATTGASNAPVYLSYLVTFLGKNIFFPLMVAGGPMDEHGVYPLSGVFARLTVKEVMEGWRDPLIAFLAPTVEYKGILGRGAQHPNVSMMESDEKYDSQYAYNTIYTGVDDVSKVGNWVVYEGLTGFHRRDELKGGVCDNAYTTTVKKDPTTCYVWEKRIEIKGTDDSSYHPPYDGKITPENYRTVTAQKSRLNVWVETVMRTFTFQRAGEEELHGVRVERFAFDTSNLMGGCTAQDPGEPCDPENDAFYMTHGRGVIPLETTLGGNPAFLTPNYWIGQDYRRDDIRDCFNMSSLPDTFDPEESMPFLLVEPITGFTVGGLTTSQANYGAFASTLNSGLHQGLFTSTGCQELIWPAYILESKAAMDEEQAQIFTKLYGVLDLADNLFLTGLIVGICLIVMSLLCFIFAWTMRPREASGSEARVVWRKPDDVPLDVSKVEPVVLAPVKEEPSKEERVKLPDAVKEQAEQVISKEPGTPAADLEVPAKSEPRKDSSDRQFKKDKLIGVRVEDI